MSLIIFDKMVEVDQLFVLCNNLVDLKQYHCPEKQRFKTSPQKAWQGNIGLQRGYCEPFFRRMVTNGGVRLARVQCF